MKPPSRRFDLPVENPASSELARDLNRDMVLELLRRRQPIARVDLARLSGLQRSTVSLIVEQLMEEGWITEGSTVRTARGRRPTMLSLNADLLMLVVDLRPEHAVCAVVDLTGRFLAQETVAITEDAASSMATLLQTLRALRHRFSEKRFEGVGVSVPGRVDPESQRLLWAPNLRWHDVDVCRALEDELQLKVEMDNAANACMLSQQWFSHADKLHHAVLVTISEGVGAAVLANGQLLLGKEGMAGEFGHILVDPNGPLCNCGEHGCWEMFASTRALLRDYQARALGTPAASVRDLVQRADAGDAHAVAAMEWQAAWVARGLRMITAALSPETILLAGDITAYWSRVGPIVERELRGRMLVGEPPRLVSLGDAETARLLGAAALVLQRHTGYRHASTTEQRPGMRSGGAWVPEAAKGSGEARVSGRADVAGGALDRLRQNAARLSRSTV